MVEENDTLTFFWKGTHVQKITAPMEVDESLEAKVFLKFACFEGGWSVDTLENVANCSWYIQNPQHVADFGTI